MPDKATYAVEVGDRRIYVSGVKAGPNERIRCNKADAMFLVRHGMAEPVTESLKRLARLTTREPEEAVDEGRETATEPRRRGRREEAEAE